MCYITFCLFFSLQEFHSLDLELDTFQQFVVYMRWHLLKISFSFKYIYILLAGSNNQFQIYESEISESFWTIKASFTSLFFCQKKSWNRENSRFIDLEFVVVSGEIMIVLTLPWYYSLTFAKAVYTLVQNFKIFAENRKLENKNEKFPCPTKIHRDTKYGFNTCDYWRRTTLMPIPLQSRILIFMLQRFHEI